MKWQEIAVLISLFTSATIVGAQSPTELPLPEVTTLIRQTILQQRFAEMKEQDYVFREDTNDIRLRKDCTWAPKCPAPFGVLGIKGVAFQVIRYSERHFEIFWLDGVRVVRTLPSCNHCGWDAQSDEPIMNIPISETELAAENERVDREVAEAKALRAQGKSTNSPDDPPPILFSKLLELCTFSNPRRQLVQERSTIFLDLAWNPSQAPESEKQALLRFFTGTIGIDEEDHALQSVEGKFIADVKLDGGSIHIRKGTRVKILNRRVDKDVWLLARLDARGEGHYFEFSIDGDGHIFVGSYRKFRSTSRILPGIVEAPNDPSAPSTPKASIPVAPH